MECVSSEEAFELNPLRRFVFVLAKFWVESLYEPTLSAPQNFGRISPIATN
jgi:hypothetical protein